MRKADGTIYIDTSIDGDGFNRGIKKMESGMSSLSKSVKKLGVAIGSVFAIKELVDFGKSALEFGSDLQEVQNVVDTTFATMSDKVDEFAKKAYKTAGLSETMAKKYAGTFGSMAKSFGFAEEESFGMAKTLTQLTGDIASFYNLTQEESYTKLKSVFTGETETLKDLGVVMTQTALDSYAMTKGFGRTTREMTEQEKVALRYSFVIEQLALASGDFQKTSNGWANQMRILSLNIESLKATMGQGLINLFTPVVQVINAVIERLKVLAEHFRAFTEDIMGIKSTKPTAKVREEVGALGDNFQETADSIKKYETASKKANNQTKKSLSPLDNLNNITEGVASNFEDISASFSGVGTNTGIPDAREEIEDTEDVLTRFSQKLKEIGKRIAGLDFGAIGNSISDYIVIGFDYIIDAIDRINWDLVGEKIGDFIGGIDWLEIIKKAFELKFNIWKAIAEIWFGAFEAAPVETAIITALGALKFTGLGAVLAKSIAGAFGGATLITAITGAFASLGGIGGILTMDMALILGAGSLAEIGVAIGTGIIGGVIAAIGGWSLGQHLYEVFSGEEIDMSWAEQFDAIRESFSDGTWKDALELWADDIAEGFKGLGDDIAEWWEDITFDIRKALGLVKDELEGISSMFTTKGTAIGIGIPAISAAIPIPHLATGAVIPPNAPFMAMLGDQRHGTNIEAPLETIKQAVAEVMAEMQNNVTFEIVGDPHGMFRVMQKEADEYFETTGRSAFPF